MDQLHQGLTIKEKALAKFHVAIKETKEVKKPSISIEKYKTMVSSPSLDLS